MHPISVWAPLWAAFSFLTRLVPARTFSAEDMAASTRWFPVTGLILGAVASLPLLASLFIVPPGSAGNPLRHPSIFAFLYIVLLFWATRGLHWDGLADCFDAWGSGAQGENFQRILKDSRIGAFGVMGIALTLAAQLICLGATLDDLGQGKSLSSVLPLLALVPAMGRAAMLVPPAFFPPHPVSTLGQIVAPGCSKRLAAGWGAVLLTAWGATQGLAALSLFLLLAALTLIFLGRLVRREGGFNGDFLGCACQVTEAAALLAAALT